MDGGKEHGRLSLAVSQLQDNAVSQERLVSQSQGVSQQVQHAVPQHNSNSRSLIIDFQESPAISVQYTSDEVVQETPTSILNADQSPNSVRIQGIQAVHQNRTEDNIIQVVDNHQDLPEVVQNELTVLKQCWADMVNEDIRHEQDNLLEEAEPEFETVFSKSQKKRTRQKNRKNAKTEMQQTRARAGGPRNLA